MARKIYSTDFKLEIVKHYLDEGIGLRTLAEQYHVDKGDIQKWRNAYIEHGIDCSAKKIKVPKSPKKLVHIYTDDEIRNIFDSITAAEPWIALRNRAMIALMLDSGLRQNEVCTLKRINISWNEGTLTVFGKGDKERVVPFGNLSRYFMIEYDKICPFKHAYFFASQKGGVVTCNAVKLLINKIAKQLPIPLSSHKLRHNFATNYCLDHYEKYGQVDIYKLMVIMGHEDIETTRKYLHHANSILASKSNISHLDKIMNL